jgi:hypothetical protein
VIQRAVYDVAGLRILMGAPPGPPFDAVRNVMRGFGPVDEAGSDSDGLPRYELVPGAGEEWQLLVDGEPARTGLSFSAALSALEWQVVTTSLEHRRDVFHIHGAALCEPALGAGIVLIGRSGSGKTTMALRLMCESFLPLADDVVLVDPETLCAQPFRRAFHVSADTWRLIRTTDDLSDARRDIPEGYCCPARWADRPLPIRWLFVLERRAGQEPRLTPLTPAETVPEILSESLTLERTPRLALATAARLTASVACYRFAVGDLDASVGALLQVLASTSDARNC